MKNKENLKNFISKVCYNLKLWNFKDKCQNRPNPVNFAKEFFVIIFSILIISTIVMAGSLTPSDIPGSTSYTLSDIYVRLTTNSSATEADHNFSPGSNPDSTFYTLKQIYEAIPTIDASKVLSGTSYLGIAGTYDASSLSVGTVKSGTSFGAGSTGDYPSATYPLTGNTVATDAAAADVCNGKEAWAKDGSLLTGTLDPLASNIGVGNSYCGSSGTLLADLFNGSDGSSFPGGSQGNGGVEDYNNGGTAPADTYSCPSGWTQCGVANNNCGTGLAGADAKDNCTGLIWSFPCNGVGCSSFSDTAPLTYTWNSSGANNESKTASQLCSGGGHGESGWSLPHLKQQMQAYVDGSYGALVEAGISYSFWSATTLSTATTGAWGANLSTGAAGSGAKTASGYVRCVRQ